MYVYYRRPSFDISVKDFFAVMFTFLMSTFISFGYTALSFHTVMSHIYILASLGGCFMIIGKIVLCRQTHLFEQVGLVWVLGGVLIMILDPNAIKDGERVRIGADLLALIVNIPWIIKFSMAAYIKKRVDMGLIVFIGTFCNFISALAYSLVFEGTSFDASDDGVWGFF